MRTLTAGDFDAVHTAFVEAFSDYAVKLSPSREQLLEMLTRRGWVPEASVGIFEGERMVAFTLNGVSEASGYDSGTGVVPSHRRSGLARQMMERSFVLLRERGCTRYVLEAIDSNAKAIELYRGLGFKEQRGLQCWAFDAGLSEARYDSTAPLPETEWDVQPAWQNTTASIRRAKDTYTIVGDAGAYAIVFPGNGDLAQFAVRRDARRRGIGTKLLLQAAAAAGKPLRIMNVDDAAEGIASFLDTAGAKRTVRQLEMIRNL